MPKSMVALKDLMAALGSPNVDCRQDGAKLEAGARGGYLFNAGIRGIEQADAILLVGTNPRLEAPVLNARIRKRYLQRQAARSRSIGAPVDLTYPVEHLGAGAATLRDARRRQGQLRREAGRRAKNPLVIVGPGALAREDGAAVLALARSLADGARRLERLHRAAHRGGRVGGLDLGFVPGEGGRDVAGILAGAQGKEIDVVFLLAADEIDTVEARQGLRRLPGPSRRRRRAPRRRDPAGCGLHREAGHLRQHRRPRAAGPARRLPAGRGPRGLGDPAGASERLGKTLPYDTLDQVRARLIAVNPRLRRARPAGRRRVGRVRQGRQRSTDAPFDSPIENFYMTDPISRASRTMAECIASRQQLAVAAE